MNSPEHPHYIPVQPLRSAMKHSSRPSTPAQAPSSPQLRSSPLAQVPSPQCRGSPLLTVPSPLISPSPSPSTVQSSYSPSPDISTPTLSAPPSLFAYGSQSPSQCATPLVASQGYMPKVSFDTLENPQASMFSYTLHVQSEGYARTRSTRVFLCASSPDESGRHALDWALECLVQDGDELIVFRGVDTEEFEKDHDQYREDARELMRQIQEKCVEYDPERKLSIIVEYIAGKVPQTVDRLISLYRPDSVVVGTRGQRSMMQAWGAAFGAPGVGSVSKYCLSHSPVPIIVVRPESKVRKTMAKRRADPKRGQHFDELTKARSNSGSLSVPMVATMTR
ncbi:Universal stress protein A family protein C25B2.10 [Grifola frondosa]|uniref:Universal stress protein A family protein C25B2.10 n=1 Tax=Grifola frondosa TaxID=5627 RepID=A0A1C7MK18_GRIFR|nr:Universal stress protein A family protein C25B2.10 [Grifola frondosa]